MNTLNYFVIGYLILWLIPFGLFALMLVRVQRLEEKLKRVRGES